LTGEPRSLNGCFDALVHRGGPLISAADAAIVVEAFDDDADQGDDSGHQGSKKYIFNEAPKQNKLK